MENMSDGAGEIRKRILRLTKNVLVLAFALVFLTLLRPELLTAIDFVAAGFMVTGDVIVNIIALLFIIYYGGQILLQLFMETCRTRGQRFSSSSSGLQNRS